jgi:hypothetical protein
MRRRDCLRATSAGAFLAALPEALLAQTSRGLRGRGRRVHRAVEQLRPLGVK